MAETLPKSVQTLDFQGNREPTWKADAEPDAHT